MPLSASVGNHSLSFDISVSFNRRVELRSIVVGQQYLVEFVSPGAIFRTSSPTHLFNL